MSDEQTNTLKALQIAVKMEIDGKEFYLIASRNAGNKMGAKLLYSLALAEDKHREKFIQIFVALRDKKGWPKTALKTDGGKSLKTIFAAATKKMAAQTSPLNEELEAVKTAMLMENKTLDFYTSLGAKATVSAEKEFYRTIAEEERMHHQALLDYYEFLKDPAGWSIKTEHSSLDGG